MNAVIAGVHPAGLLEDVEGMIVDGCGFSGESGGGEGLWTRRAVGNVV